MLSVGGSDNNGNARDSMILRTAISISVLLITDQHRNICRIRIFRTHNPMSGRLEGVWQQQEPTVHADTSTLTVLQEVRQHPIAISSKLTNKFSAAAMVAGLVAYMLQIPAHRERIEQTAGSNIRNWSKTVRDYIISTGHHRWDASRQDWGHFPMVYNQETPVNQHGDPVCAAAPQKRGDTNVFDGPVCLSPAQASAMSASLASKHHTSTSMPVPHPTSSIVAAQPTLPTANPGLIQTSWYALSLLFLSC